LRLQLICEGKGCLRGTHTYCCDPVLADVPTGEWLCEYCQKRYDTW